DSQNILQSRTLLFHVCNLHRRHAPSPAEYGSTSVFWAMRLGYSDINMSTGPGIFIKIKKVNGELINIGSCRGPPAKPSRTTRGPRTPGCKPLMLMDLAV